MQTKRAEMVKKLIQAGLFFGDQKGETMEILVPVEVPVEGVAFIKRICVELDLDFPRLTESILQEFFVLGMTAFLEGLKTEYSSPLSLIKDIMDTP